MLMPSVPKRATYEIFTSGSQDSVDVPKFIFSLLPEKVSFKLLKLLIIQIYLDSIGSLFLFLINHFRIYLCRLHVGMSQHLAYGIDVCTMCQLERSVGMPETMHKLSKSNGK